MAVYASPSQPGSGEQVQTSIVFGPLAAPVTITDQTVDADVAVLTLTGQTATVTGSGTATVTADVATLTLTGQTPTGSGSGTATVTADPAALTLTGQDVTSSATGTATVTADVAALTLSGQDVTVSGTGTATVAADVATLTLTGQDVTATGGATGSTTADVATMTLTGQDVTAVGTGTATTAADVAALTLTGQTSTITGTGTATVAADAATLTLTGQTSTITGTGTATVAADVATLTLTGLSVGSGGGSVTNADVAALTLAGQAVAASTIPTAIQEGFRFRNDDGSETTATWLAAQDTNTSRDLATATRLRMVLDTTTAPPSQPYTLYYKKSTDSTWLPVPVGAGGGAPVYVATSTNITASGEATTAQLTPPAGKTTGDFCVGRMWDDENGIDAIDLDCAGGGGSEAVTMTMQAMKPSSMLNENCTIRAQVLVTADGFVPGQGDLPGWATVNEPVGTVTFYDGGTPMLTTNLNIYGEADVVRTNLSVGTHNITATYSGTATYATGSAGPVVQTVTSAKTAPTLSTWQANYDSLDLTGITAWYRYNTGHLTEGYSHSSLWNPAGGSSTADVIVDAAWLAANVGANVVNDGGGHWTITGLHTSQIEIRVSNLTFRHCWIDRQDFATVWGNGITFYEVGVGVDYINLTNIVIEYCTLTTDGTGVESGGWGSDVGSFGESVGYVPITPITTADNVVLNNCEISQFRAGFLTWGGVTLNYCWVHTLDLFGMDPHNTASSIRAEHTLLYRNLYCDGTSSDVSLYADSTPYTNWWVVENIMWLDGDHASQEINFPQRDTAPGFGSPTNFHRLYDPTTDAPIAGTSGYVREFMGNLMKDGTGGDFHFFTKIAGNRQLGTGKKLWGCADMVQTATDPSVLTMMTPVEYFGHAETYKTFQYTPSPNSTLFLFQATGQFAHATTPSLSITDTSGGSWTAMTGAATPVEGYWGDANYGLSGEIRTQTPGATPAFRHVTIDPYATADETVGATMIAEVTGRTGMTLTQAVALSAKGNATSFGAHLGTFTSGTLSSAATTGHLVMWFIAYRHEDEDEGGIPAPPAGWNMTGNNWDSVVGAAVLWRKDFTGTSVTIADMGILNVAVSILCEFN